MANVNVMEMRQCLKKLIVWGRIVWGGIVTWWNCVGVELGHGGIVWGWNWNTVELCRVELLQSKTIFITRLLGLQNCLHIKTTCVARSFLYKITFVIKLPLLQNYFAYKTAFNSRLIFGHD
jgi:hypothetical protein